MHHQFDGVGDDLAGHERGPHSLVAHGDAVRNGDGRELESDRTRLTNADLRETRELRPGDVARRHLVTCRHHPDL